MISMPVNRAAQLLDCAPAINNPVFRGISCDSREVKPGMLFAALSGDRSDGHDFVTPALDSGAAAVLVSVPLELPGGQPVAQLVVNDVLGALGTLATEWRKELDPCVIGITGSNGKTTTREMVSSILAQNAEVHSTSGNYNNELGLPLTLFGLEKSHRYCVLEMGAARQGDIRYLAGIASPSLGLVTNVGPAHLQGFGDEEGVARAKGELYESLPSDGTAIINADEPWSDLWLEMNSAGNSLTFGQQPDCSVFPRQIEKGYGIQTPNGDFAPKLNLPGNHNFQNALAATAVAVALDIPVQQIQSGLEAVRAIPGRLNLLHTKAGWTVIDDTYNANPASLYAALQVLAGVPGESWLVLGDMKELGQGSRKIHGEMGEAARALGVTRIFAVGDATVFTVDAFGSGGRHFSDHASLIDVLCAELRPGIACLVKGSRSMAMEQVVDAISESREMREAG